MTVPRSAPVHPKVWVTLALAVIGLGILAVVIDKPATADRVVILASSLNDRGRDVGPGMETLLSDCLEVLTGATVTHAPALPAPAILKRLPPETRLLRFQGGRDADRLTLALEWTTVARLLSDQPWIEEPCPDDEPWPTMEHAIQHWPLALRHRLPERLIPRSAPNFWLLLEGLSIQDDQAAAAHLPTSQKLAEDEPDCATAWTCLGDHLYRSFWVNPDQTGIGLNSRTHHAFQKAGGLIPGHPRATFLWSMMLTDTGNQSLALKLLEEALRLRPGTPDLYLGIAYAGRTSGLLEGARRALARRTELIGPLASPSAWFAETTYLYLGDQAAFGQELARAGELRQDASILFYKGYFALLQGNRQQALGFMVPGSDPGMAPPPFRDLCRVYRAYLEGKPEEGLLELREIDEIRGKLRIPDGEWTFKEAEAYSLLGDRDRGMDCATRAFVQGFSCSTWYEASPFLEKVREHPRWPMLRRNIRERQAVLAGSFPATTFVP
jgi:tetratricopeptide (TPR) repeat protein